jgi:hypothetical protein
MPPTHPQVFISYRRDDGAGYARAIAAELSKRFGGDRVFMDVDDIAAGHSFAEVIHRAVGGASVLLVLIGRRWRGEREGADARLNDPGDFVRLEVAAGLRRGMRVIPVLLDGASMPAVTELPSDIQALTGLQALEIGNTRFAADIDRLAAALADTLGAPTPPTDRRRWLALGAGALSAAVLGTGWWIYATARPDINGEWQAELRYEWEKQPRTERFRFIGEGKELNGTASFLGSSRGLLEGQVDRDGLSFSTRTGEMGGPDQLHRYRGRLADDGSLHFVMQTEGGSGPVEFIAKRIDHAERR